MQKSLDKSQELNEDNLENLMYIYLSIVNYQLDKS
jgi:hypothetical protein